MWWEVLLLGALQGLTEFIPVSSSGHLLALPFLFDLSLPPLELGIYLHLATLCAVVVYFRRDFARLARRPLSPAPSQSLLLYLVLGTIPAATAGMLFEEGIRGAFASPDRLVFFFPLTAAQLLAADRLPSKEKPLSALGVRGALFVGLLQALALFPGVSRMGSTLLGGLLIGLSREAAAKFSFFLAVPAILGSAIFDIKEMVLLDPTTLLTGFCSAFLFGLLAIDILMRVAVQSRLSIFAPYLLFLTVAVAFKSYA